MVPDHSLWQLNTCYNAIDRHVEQGHGSRTAIIYDSPVTNQKRKISYEELLNHVSVFSAILTKYTVRKGDRVLIYMVSMDDVNQQVNKKAEFDTPRSHTANDPTSSHCNARVRTDRGGA